MMSDKIILAHGAGGKFSRKLMRDVILPAFDNEILREMHDGAVLDRPDGKLVLLPVLIALLYSYREWYAVHDNLPMPGWQL